MACRNLVMVGYFLSVKGFFFFCVCVQQVSVSRLDWCRASSWVQGSAFCRFSMQGRCGCSQREGGHRPTPRHTDRVFRSRLHPITRPLLHTQASTIIFCPFFPFLFYAPHLSVQHAFLSISHPAVFTSQSKCLSIRRFAAMPSKKKTLSTLMHIHYHAFFRSSFLAIYFSHSLFGSRSPCQGPRGV